MATLDEVNWILSHENDYYGMLGVSGSADDATIRRRYYALTLKLHPDKNPGDERAALACRHVMDAYSVLKDQSRRKVYDTYGTKGISRLDQMGGEIPSVSEMLRTIGSFVLALFLRFVGRRFLCLEQLPKLFPFTNETENDESAEDADAGLDEASRAARHVRKKEMLFVKAHERDRSQTRRFVLTVFAAVLAVTCGLSLYARVSCSTAPEVTIGNASTPLDPITVLFPSAAVDSGKAGTPFTFDYLCVPSKLTQMSATAALRELSPEELGSFLDCQRRTRPSASASSLVVTLRRYAGSDDMARTGFYDYLSQRCALENELAWASRERYEKLATVRRATPLVTPKSPNQAPRRKYPKQTWRPKFTESFTIENEGDLFQVSPLCQPLLSH